MILNCNPRDLSLNNVLYNTVAVLKPDMTYINSACIFHYSMSHIAFRKIFVSLLQLQHQPFCKNAHTGQLNFSYEN